MTFDGIEEKDWLEELESIQDWNVRHCLTALAVLGIPKTLLDVGCGICTMMNTVSNLDVETFGIDQFEGSWVRNNYKQHNLVNPYLHEHKFQQVWCIEVAEHLDASAHATLCDTLVNNLEDHGYLLFSAAHPNQGGMGHVSERPVKYWLDQFALRDLSFHQELTVRLSLLWSNIGSPLYWLPANVLIFNKGVMT